MKKRHINKYKVKQQRDYTLMRLKQRYPLLTKLTEDDLKEISAKIRNNNAKFLSRTSKTRTVWLVEYKDRIIKVVYSNINKQIITALPLKKEDLDVR